LIVVRRVELAAVLVVVGIYRLSKSFKPTLNKSHDHVC
jgi:hypothetical protein